VKTLALDMGRVRSHEEVVPGNINILAIEEQQDTMDTYTAYDIGTGEVVPDNGVANGQPYFSLSESNILSAVYDNGKNIYGEDFIRLDQLYTIYPVTGVLVDSLPLHIFKKWDIFVNGGWSGNSGPQEEDDCLRDKRDFTDYVCKMKFKSKNALDNITDDDEPGMFGNRRLLFKFVVVYSEVINNSTTVKKLPKFFLVKKKHLWGYYNWSALPTSFYVSLNTLNWNPSLMGPTMKYQWYELDDDGNTTTTTLNLPDSNGSVSIKNTPKDDDLGADLVDYCHNSAWPGHKYDTGLINFWVGD
jgi:hypothetical protein